MEKMMANDADLKVLVKAIGDSGLLVSELSQGISLKEIGQLLSVVHDFPEVIKRADVFFPEFLELDADAQADLIAYIQANVVYPANATVEFFAQKILSAIVQLSSVIQFLTGSKKNA